jgi:hypothetical protein
MKRVSPSPVIHEPLPDWVPLERAPYHCFEEGLVASPDDWRHTIQAKLEQAIQEEALSRETKESQEEGQFQSAQWSFEAGTQVFLPWALQMRSGGVETRIISGAASIRLARSDCIVAVAPGEHPPRYNHSWDPVGVQQASSEELKAAARHSRVLSRVDRSLLVNFREGVSSGALYIMARKNTVLAPFERVTWDQWQYFKLDENGWHLPLVPTWIDPRRRGYADWGFNSVGRCSATGPKDDRLFAIHVAPGLRRMGGDSPAVKCEKWVRELLREFPNKAPKVQADLLDEGVRRFPGLPKNAIKNIMLGTLRQVGPEDWFPVGRPKSKFSKKTP